MRITKCDTETRSDQTLLEKLRQETCSTHTDLQLVNNAVSGSDNVKYDKIRSTCTYSNGSQTVWAEDPFIF